MRRRLQLNEHAFEANTPESAYWGGFVFGDGCVNAGIRFRVALSERDRTHLEKLRRFLGSGHAISTRDNSSRGVCANRPATYVNGGVYRISTFAVCSRILVASLRRYGIIERTARAVPARIANDRDFWRGLVDADGTIDAKARYEAGKPVFTPSLRLCSPRTVCEAFANFIAERVDARTTIGPQGSIFYASIHGRRQVTKALRLLYADATISLERKYALYEAVNEFARRVDRKTLELRNRKCSVKGCTFGPAVTRGMCHIHYSRWYEKHKRGKQDRPRNRIVASARHTIVQDAIKEAA